ncbi:MAG TPA: hypothetical protein VL485_05685 [Ktedonobacteraceae bacterium]|jgi:hypothetical protein|nr:hypothetical protein [Ktedonobacteraceae bacterium]
MPASLEQLDLLLLTVAKTRRVQQDDIHFMMQVEHVLVANQLQVVTKEVVETARDNLIIGD